MGVYIKGMEMPKENDYTIAIVYGDGVVTEYHEDYWIRGADGEKQFGTAIPVPPHGRLIDADALRESFRESIEECHKWADEVDKDTMMYARISQSLGTFVECSLRTKAAPTIIESEEST